MSYSVLLKNTDFGYFFEIKNVDDICNEKIKLIFSIFDETCPTGKVRISKDEQPYMTPSLEALRKKKQRMQRKRRRCRIRRI